MNDYARKEKKVRFINVGPGPNKTPMTNGNGMLVWVKALRRLLFSLPTKGANYLYSAAFDEKYRNLTGVYVSVGRLRRVKLVLQPDKINEVVNN